MRANLKTTLLALAIIVPASGAWTTANQVLELQPQSRLWIDGTSTVRSFSCKAGEVSAVLDANGTDPIVQLLTGEKAVKAVKVTVPAEKLSDARLEELKTALKSITGEMTDIFVREFGKFGKDAQAGPYILFAHTRH